MKGMVIQKVPWNQPSASLLKCRLWGRGDGGYWAGPRSSSVSGHQIRKITTITVVICMIRSALPLDSCMPLMLSHQKYKVTRMAKPAENALGGTCSFEWNSPLISL